MLNQFFEVIRQVFTLTENMQRNQAAITALQKDLRELSQREEEGRRMCESAIERLAYELQRLREELHHAMRHEADEREKFQLKIENQMLKARLGLPAAEEKSDDQKGEQQ